MIQKLSLLIPAPSPNDVVVSISEDSTTEEIISFLSEEKNTIPPNLSDLLSCLNATQLRAICRNRLITCPNSMNKDALKDHMLELLDPTRVKRKILDTIYTMEESPRVIIESADEKNSKNIDDPHVFYGKNFNAVDLFDRQYYNGLRKFKIMEWKAVWVTSLMSLGLINIWTIYHEIKPNNADHPNMLFKFFKRDLMMKLLKKESTSIYLREWILDDELDVKDKIIKKIRENKKKYEENRLQRIANQKNNSGKKDE